MVEDQWKIERAGWIGVKINGMWRVEDGLDGLL